jgi:hypothetical protein
VGLKSYVVRSGDYLTQIAFALRVDPEAVWNDPKNAELNSRRDPNLLHPGDVLFVPDSPPTPLDIEVGTTNRYVADVPTTQVQLQFQDADQPYANEPYSADLAGQVEEGTLDGNGSLTLEVPIHVREVRLTFPKRKITHVVQVGDMDPIDEPSGVRKRLQHLGYMAADESGTLDEDLRDEYTKAAIALFQEAMGLKATGELDDATKGALVKAHGA